MKAFVLGITINCLLDLAMTKSNKEIAEKYELIGKQEIIKEKTRHNTFQFGFNLVVVVFGLILLLGN